MNDENQHAAPPPVFGTAGAMPASSDEDRVPPPPPVPQSPVVPPPPPVPQSPVAPPPPPTYGAPRAVPPPQYGYAVGYVPVIVRNNGMAIASMVSSIASLFLGIFFVPEVLGIVFGHVALSQIRRSQGREQGSGMAIAGLVIGYLMLAFWLVIVIVAASSPNNSGTNY